MLMSSNMKIIEDARKILSEYDWNRPLTPEEVSKLSSAVAIAKLAEQTRNRQDRVERLNTEEIERRVKKEVERQKKEVMQLVKSRLIGDISQGMKGIFLLSLKKKNWGAKRAQDLFADIATIEDALDEGRITWDDIFEQVMLEYGIDIRIEKIVKTPEEVMKCKRQKKD